MKEPTLAEAIVNEMEWLRSALRYIDENGDCVLAAEVIERRLVALQEALGAQKIDLTSMSVNNALIQIAKVRGGLIVTKEAIATLTKAGVFSTKGEANDNIHSTLRRSRYFKREGRGVYRLVLGPSPSTEGRKDGLLGSVRP